MAEAEVTKLTKQDAIDRVNRYWTPGHVRTPDGVRSTSVVRRVALCQSS